MTANLPEEKRSPHALTCRDFGTWFITRRVARKDKKMLNCHTKCKKKPIIISSTIQVEDVNKKFEALKDAESRAWVEERKPPPRPKRLVKVKSLHVHTCLHYNSTACYLVVYISKNFDLSYSETVSCPRQANRKQSSSKVSPGCCKSCHEGQTAGSREHQLQC